MKEDAGFPDFNRKTAYVIILIFGVVSLFGDIIYEGARSVTGPTSIISVRQPLF